MFVIVLHFHVMTKRLLDVRRKRTPKQSSEILFVKSTFTVNYQYILTLHVTKQKF